MSNPEPTTDTSHTQSLAAAAQSPLAKAKRAHTQAVNHLAVVRHDSEKRAAEAQAKIDAAREALRDAARREAESAPVLSPEKRACLRVLLSEAKLAD